MNKYFRGFMPADENNSQTNISSSAEQNTNNNIQVMPSTEENHNAAMNNLPSGNNQNNENTSSNNPLYPINGAENNSHDSAIDEFNRGLAEGIRNNTQSESQTSESLSNAEQQFEMPYTGNGSLSVQAFTAGQALPIENVKITITSDEPQTKDIHEVRYTNSSGRTEPIVLPAPSLFLSQQSQNTIRPYAIYKIVSEAEGYTANNLPRDAIVFDQIESIQNIELIPTRESQV